MSDMTPLQRARQRYINRAEEKAGEDMDFEHDATRRWRCLQIKQAIEAATIRWDEAWKSFDNTLTICIGSGSTTTEAIEVAYDVLAKSGMDDADELAEAFLRALDEEVVL